MSVLQRKETSVNGRLVSYLFRPAQQNTSAPALVFLHGWRSEAAAWQGMLRALPWAGALYALDLPGFGQSPAFETATAGAAHEQGATIADYGRLVEDFIAKQKLVTVVLIGHSFGGRIAIKLAAAQPQWLTRLVLTGAAGVERSLGSSLKRGLMRAAAKTVKPLFAPRAMHPVRRRIYAWLGSDDYVATPALVGTFQNVITEDLAPSLEHIAVPTLLVWGSNDDTTPVRYGQLMEQSVPRSRLTVIEGAGHYVFLDQPQRFIAALTTFLNG